MPDLRTTIGLEIHVQLKTKSKMFCCCDNQSYAEATDGKQSEGKKPNTTVCPVCLGMPGSLPVANKEAILWTIKTGLALNCKIPEIAKFDRKHYFYPDLPKGYQISQYDEPFCIGGQVEVDGDKINLTRIHLEEDAGKLIHPSRDRAETGSNGKSLVDLNRAGTPLMEIVTEPDITSPLQAGKFLRKLQKIVRDEVAVSDADMEKGHLRCDANISVTDGKRMSEIVELKNINSFRFVEKALSIEESRLKKEYPDWSEGGTKVTRGYDSKKNLTYAQRKKEQAADYRYFPEPDLPPVNTGFFDMTVLKSEIGVSEESKIEELTKLGLSELDARVLVANRAKEIFFKRISESCDDIILVAKAIINNYFGIEFNASDSEKAEEYCSLISALKNGRIKKNNFSQIAQRIHKGESFDKIIIEFKEEQIPLEKIVSQVLSENPAELSKYKAGKKQLYGFFIGQVMKKTEGKADPNEVNKILREKLEEN